MKLRKPRLYLRDSFTHSDPVGYVGFKLVGLMACSVQGALPTPAIALQYAERLKALLMELIASYDCAEVRRMLRQTDALINDLDEAQAEEAVRRLLR